MSKGSTRSRTLVLKRRLALKTLSGGALAGGLLEAMPKSWQRPLINSGVLPAHAQQSPLSGASPEISPSESGSLSAYRSASDGSLWQAIGQSADFITAWTVDENDLDIRIPALAVRGKSLEYTVDWGDDSEQETSAGQAEHAYAAAGTYIVRISGQLPRIKFGHADRHRKKLRTIEQWGNIEWASLISAFEGCENLQVPARDAPNLSGVTSLRRMFRGATALTGDFSGWGTQNVTDMVGMFWGARSFTSELGNWDVSSVTQMNSMFRDAAAFDGDISGWDVSNVISMYGMFQGATAFDGNLGGWDVSRVVNMRYMFTGAALSLESYDALLQGWSVLPVQRHVKFDAGGSQYNTAANARQVLVDQGWRISDGGQVAWSIDGTAVFITTWAVEAGDLSITIPAYSVGERTRDYWVDWGDGSAPEHSTGQAEHTYAAAGTYPVKITGRLPRIKFGYANRDRSKLRSIQQWGHNQWMSMESAFESCENLQILAKDAPDLDSVTSLRRMFRGANVLTGDFSGWDTKNVTDMVGVFWGAWYFNGDLSNWDVSRVTQMNSMFRDAAAFSGDISGWDVSNVISMHNMFDSATAFDGNLGNWDVSRVVNMRNMFTGAALSTEKYDVLLQGWSGLALRRNVKFDAGDSQYTAAAARQILVDQGWRIEDGGQAPQRVEDGGGQPIDETTAFITTWTVEAGDLNIKIPADAANLGRRLDYWVDWGDGSAPEHATDQIEHLYAVAGTYTVKIGGRLPKIKFHYTDRHRNKLRTIEQWGNIEWASMKSAFEGCENLQIPAQDAPELNSVTSMRRMFRGATALTGDFSGWETKNVTDMGAMFWGARSFTSELGNWDVSSVTQMNSMFRDAAAFDGDISGWDVSNVISMYGMFQGATAFDGNLGGWDVSRVVNMRYMFTGAALSLENYDALLQEWSVLPVQRHVKFDAGDSQYNTAAAARQILINHGWRISDGGPVAWSIDGASVFITTWTVEAGDLGITIPAYSVGERTRDYRVDWGDGSAPEHSTGQAEHTYAAAGTYPVKIIGRLPRIKFGYANRDRNKLSTVEQWGNIEWMSMESAFEGCENLHISAQDAPNLSGVTSLRRMFRGANVLTGDFSGWDTKNVTDMVGVFWGAWYFNGDLSNWDVSSVTQMNSMFRDAAAFDGDISGWDVSNVISMYGMFQGATAFDGNLGNWDVGRVTGMRYMFIGSALGTENYDALLQGWSALPVQRHVKFDVGDTQYTREAAAARQILINHGWRIRDGGQVADLIDEASAFITTWAVEAGDLSITIPVLGFAGEAPEYWIDWGDDSAVEYSTGQAEHTYAAAGTYTVKIAGRLPRLFNSHRNRSNRNKLRTIEQWGNIEWASMRSAFSGCEHLQSRAQDAPDLTGVNDMSLMFSGAISFDGDLSGWDTGHVTNMYSMFSGASSFNGDIGGWDTGRVTDMSWMFLRASAFNRDLSDWNTGRVTDMSGMFYGATVFNGDISGWDTGNVTRMASMFCRAAAFNGNIGDWDTGSVTSMAVMFSGATAFNADVSGWDVGRVTDMREMFSTAISFNGDLGNWNVGRVTRMLRMFYGATSFNRDLGGWNVGNVQFMTDMFEDVTLSTENYDALLQGWSDLPLRRDVEFDAGNSQYSANAAAARQILVDEGWSITDGGQVPYLIDDATAFITTWTVEAGDLSITIPAFGVGDETPDYRIDWGDDSAVEHSTGQAEHTYAAAGTYTVKIAGQLPRIRVVGYENGTRLYRQNRLKLRTIEQWGDIEWKSMESAFMDCINLEVPARDAPDLSGVTSMAHMFAWTDSFNGDINGWDVGNVIDMSWMFDSASSFNGDISDWDTGNVTDMRGMFFDATDFNGDISGWDVSRVTNMSYMFEEATSFNRDLRRWNTGNVTDMRNMFYRATAFNGDISGWDVGNVTEMGSMFDEATSFNGDISGWDTGNVDSMYNMFLGATAFNGDISGWDVGNVTNMNGMFYGATAFNADISGWDVSRVNHMGTMFRGATAFNQDISDWDVGNVTGMVGMFNGATAFNGDISGWNVRNVQYMTDMFGGVTLSTENYDALLHGWSGLPVQPNVPFDAGNSQYSPDAAAARQILVDEGWEIEDGGQAPYLIDDAAAFITTWTVEAGDLSIEIPALDSEDETPDYLIDWGDDSVVERSTGQAEHVYASAGTYTIKIAGQLPRLLFKDHSGRSRIRSIEQWGNIEWANMRDAFYGCEHLQNNAQDAPDLSGVADMGFMFHGAASFNGDLSGWDVSRVDDMECMFSAATSFNGDIGNWNVGNVTDMNGMFYDAAAFNGDISGWNVANVINMDHMFYRATAFGGDISRWNVRSATRMTEMFSGVTLSTENYDALLQAWSDRAVQRNVRFSAGNSQYTLEAAAARQILVDKGWRISDGGQVPLPIDDATAFITTWTVEAGDLSIEIPAFNVGDETPDYTIDWGDGSAAERSIGQAEHVYAAAGTYTVKIAGRLPRLRFKNHSDRSRIRSIEQWGAIEWANMRDAFYGCQHLQNNASDAPDLSRVADMGFMLHRAFAFDGNLNNWDVSRVTDMECLFSDTPFNGDISDWNVGRVVDMHGMFDSATRFNGDISGWDVGQVINMTGMFHAAPKFNQDISSWNVANVTNMEHMFADAAAFNRNLGGWDVGRVTGMRHMFTGAALSTENYDALLQGWSDLAVQRNVRFDAGDAQYSLEAAAARQILVDRGWHISDGGQVALRIDESTAFITTWKVGPGDPSIEISVLSVGDETPDYLIDWGDGSAVERSTGRAGHTYASRGTYTVKIAGRLPQLDLSESRSRNKIRKIEQWGDIKWASMQGAFRNCKKLKINASDAPDLSRVTDMASMFEQATSLDGDLSSWNVENVTHMSGMFEGATSFNGDISGWNVGNVTRMSEMFEDATSFNGDISSWNVGNVVSMFNMFHNATSFNGNISGWNVGNVTRMDGMFWGATSFNGDISGWNVGNVTYMDGMFKNATSFNGDLSSWNVGNVTYMYEMFHNATSFNGDISRWNVRRVFSMSSMFDGASAFNGDISGWNVGNVTRMAEMFSGVTLSTENYDALLQGWSGLPVQRDVKFDAGSSQYSPDAAAARQVLVNKGWEITDGGQAPYLIDDATAFITTWTVEAGDLSIKIPAQDAGGETPDYLVDWGDDSAVERSTGQAEHTYASAGTYTVKIAGRLLWIQVGYDNANNQYSRNRFKLRTIEQWGDIEWKNMASAFRGCVNLEVPAQDAPDLSGVTSMAHMFEWTGTNFVNGGISGWDVGNVTDMSYMFADAPAFNGDISGWDVSRVTDMSYMFILTTSFNGDISGWDVGNVTDMSGMFALTTAFNRDLSDWDTGNVTDMSDMFLRAPAFNGDISGWDVSRVTNMSEMFSSATSFNKDLSYWNTENVTDMHGMFWNATAFNGDISGWDVGNVTDMSYMFADAPAFNGDISGWDVGNVTNMSFMLRNAHAFNADISGWDVGNARSMERMFVYATSFDRNLGSWDVGNVVNMNVMFYGVTLSTENYDALLRGWSSLPAVQPDVLFGAGNSQYSPDAAAARQILVDKGWEITDGGQRTVDTADARMDINKPLAPAAASVVPDNVSLAASPPKEIG